MRLEAHVGYCPDPISAPVAASDNVGDSDVDLDCFAGPGLVQAGAGWLPGPTIHVLQVSNHGRWGRHGDS